MMLMRTAFVASDVPPPNVNWSIEMSASRSDVTVLTSIRCWSRNAPFPRRAVKVVERNGRCVAATTGVQLSSRLSETA
jgi:hypothetical protein